MPFVLRKVRTLLSAAVSCCRSRFFFLLFLILTLLAERWFFALQLLQTRRPGSVLRSCWHCTQMRRTERMLASPTR